MPDPMDGKIGFTNDGKVFYMAAEAVGNGETRPIILTWEPTIAIGIAEHLHHAAIKAQEAMMEAKENDSPGIDKSGSPD